MMEAKDLNKMRGINFLICPLDSQKFYLEKNSIKCKNGHTFDISKEGYINLLLSKKKLPGTLGDTKEMLDSRTEFLLSGYYEPLAEEIKNFGKEFIFSRFKNKGDSKCIVEVGCGTAYYIENLRKAIESEKVDTFTYLGTDISKTAVKFASKRIKDVTFLVCDTYSSIPIETGSVALILNVFSPRKIKEFKRLTSENGGVLVVIPNEDHLSEVIEPLNLMKIEPEKEDKIKNIFKKENFLLIKEKRINYKIDLDSEMIINLIKMGPNYWKLKESTIQEIKSMKNKRISISVKLMLFIKDNDK